MSLAFSTLRNDERGTAVGGVVVVITLAMLAFLAALTFAVYTSHPLPR
jgi:hypothetical protein